MTLTFDVINDCQLDEILAIEQACHSHPWSKALLASCLTERYFSEFASVSTHMIGFYIADYIAGEVTLMDICIAPACQGKGYGKKLLDRFILQAKQKQAEQIFLEVRASNIAAQKLYLSAGFSQIAQRKGYYPTEDGHEDAIIMQLIL